MALLMAQKYEELIALWNRADDKTRPALNNTVSIAYFEQGLALLGVPQRSYHDLVEQPRRTLDDFEMSVVDGIE